MLVTGGCAVRCKKKCEKVFKKPLWIKKGGRFAPVNEAKQRWRKRCSAAPKIHIGPVHLIRRLKAKNIFFFKKKLGRLKKAVHLQRFGEQAETKKE